MMLECLGLQCMRTNDLMQATKHACTAGYKNVAIRILACSITSINFPSQHVALFMQKLKEKLQKHRTGHWIVLLSNAC